MDNEQPSSEVVRWPGTDGSIAPSAHTACACQYSSDHADEAARRFQDDLPSIWTAAAMCQMGAAPLNAEGRAMPEAQGAGITLAQPTWGNGYSFDASSLMELGTLAPFSQPVFTPSQADLGHDPLTPSRTCTCECMNAYSPHTPSSEKRTMAWDECGPIHSRSVNFPCAFAPPCPTVNPAVLLLDSNKAPSPWSAVDSNLDGALVPELSPGANNDHPESPFAPLGDGKMDFQTSMAKQETAGSLPMPTLVRPMNGEEKGATSRAESLPCGKGGRRRVSR
ncbi:hypothetical protein BS50DRAFT_594870 [Corynespora cassiicola Philippines]|uniref:Uncharacterized protein n=1 Tax=Corynespora cassiicola Philippines TaxID=1448308 RepID=A0A2T2N159_CORCC|nr:hypothetical protein BS50DRAFT_594870 [Corynespora cassiicola Philippines]